MSLKSILESFTKVEIQDLLTKCKDTDYRASWIKAKLINHLLSYETETVLKTFTSNQLKAGLEV